MSGAGGPRPYSPHGDRSDLAARYASGGDHLPVSMPTWASDRHDGASSLRDDPAGAFEPGNARWQVGRPKVSMGADRPLGHVEPVKNGLRPGDHFLKTASF